MRKQFLLFLVLCSLASATTYTVGSGKTYATPALCAAAANAGDTCQIFAGSYAGWTQSKSGSAGNVITFTINGTDTVVTITSGVTITSRNYVTFNGLHFLSGGFTGDGNFTHITISNCTFTGKSLDSGNSAIGNSDNIFSNNIITVPTGNKTITIFLYGDRNRIEYNEYSGSGDDFLNMGGANNIIRFNNVHDLNALGSVTNNHIDFLQAQPASPNLTLSLIEHNREIGCLNDGGNCHALILRGDSSTKIDGVIYRFNYAQNLDGSGIVNAGGPSDWATNTAAYNNVIASEDVGDGGAGAFISCYGQAGTGTAGVIIVNNISYNSGTNGQSPFNCTSGDGLLFASGNIAYGTGYSGSWGAPYSSESTYATLRNLNPLFTNYPSDVTLQSGSPARNAGANLSSVVTTVTNSTSLTVTRGHAFQPGWAGTNGDCIRIGAATVTCISGISYSGTNGVLTVSPAVSATSGDAVNLYSDSSATVVLNSAKPDIGAYPFSSGSPTAATPTFVPVGGTYIGAQAVVITSTTAGCTICFSTDGSTPAASTPGTCSTGTTLTNGGSVTISASGTVLKAIATITGYTNSAVASATYTLNLPTAAPTVGLFAGRFVSTGRTVLP